jgi:hypothetical protein
MNKSEEYCRQQSTMLISTCNAVTLDNTIKKNPSETGVIQENIFYLRGQGETGFHFHFCYPHFLAPIV